MSEIILSETAQNIQFGIYEHYKGGMYKVLGVALHSETREEMVIYKALYDSQLTWVRPLEMFLGEVTVNDIKQPRFRFVETKS
jgi:hypothetical protein